MGIIKHLRSLLNLGMFTSKENNSKMEELLNIEEQLKLFKYQWIKGDKLGEVCTISNVTMDSDEETMWVNFTDKSRINYALMNEFLLKVNQGEELDLDISKKPNKQVSSAEPKVTLKKIQQESPVLQLLRKQKEHPTEITVTMVVNVPNKALYDILKSSFDDADKDIMEFVMQSMDMESVKDAIKQSILSSYDE
jgi:hypothetical protein